MKKILCTLFIAVGVFFNSAVLASDIEFVLENADTGIVNNFENSLNSGIAITEVNNKEYCFYYANSTQKCQEYTDAYKVFSDEFGVNATYLWTGKNYLVSSGGGVLMPGSYMLADEREKTLGIYDENLCLLGHKAFEGVVTEFFVKDSICYVKIGVGKERHDYEYRYYMSRDLNDWDKIEEQIYNNKQSVVIYENEKLASNDIQVCAQRNWFTWNIKRDVENQTTYVFIDESRSLKVDMEWDYLGGFVFAYEDNSNFYISGNEQKYKTPKSPFYAELERLRQAPVIQIDNQVLSFETAPTIEDGRTLVPMRFLFETLGADVNWDNDTRTAAVNKDGDTIAFAIDNTEAIVNGTPADMDVPARLIDGKTFVPIRFLSENLGYDVEYDENNNKVIIHTLE